MPAVGPDSAENLGWSVGVWSIGTVVNIFVVGAEKTTEIPQSQYIDKALSLSWR